MGGSPRGALAALAVGAALAAVGALASPAEAVVPRSRARVRIAADTLTAMPAAAITKPLRTHVTTRAPLAHEGPAWDAFTVGAGGTWTATWDAATGVPSRVYGSGMPAPGTIANAAAAEATARYMLAAHLALLAPGAAATDFELVSNRLDGDLRSIGFVQRAGGRRVVGGQIGFEFKHDRLFVIGSSALPNVVVVEPRARLATSALHDRTAAALRDALELPAAPVTAPDAEVVLPLVGDDAVLGYRVATPLTIDGAIDGRYLAYADPSSGDVIAVHQQNLYETGTVLYRGIDRYPANGRVDRPVPRAYVSVGGATQTTSTAGVVTWSAAAAQPVVPAVVGDLVKIVDQGTNGPLYAPTLSLAPADQVLWDASVAVESDAQLNLYLDANIVKAFVAGFAPDMATLGDQLLVYANIDEACNSYFDGTSIHMFHATSQCQNTGLVQDVVFHEFGHDLHVNEIIAGVGAFDGAMSEGAADFLAVNVTEDHGFGRGFFYNNTPLRDLDPAHGEATWPKDIGEIHTTGLIFGGTFWDLRTAAIAAYGHDAGVALVLQWYIGALRRSTDIPSSLIEVLATDDDDGDLSNGTPHECMIRDTFGKHGLREVSGSIEAPGALATPAGAITIAIVVDGLSTRCAGDTLRGAELSWKPGPLGAPAADSAGATLTTGTPQFYATLPLAAHDSVLYQTEVEFADITVFTLPDNFADPYYQLYDGATVPLYCNDFESGDPLLNGWSTGTSNNFPSPWQWGVPGGGATDPQVAYSGTHILAQGLGTDYAPNTTSYVTLPPIEIGNYSDVRLQYRRWLAVEDSHFDQAHITANTAQVWINATDNMGDSSDLDHLDREWRFHDVPLSTAFTGPTLTVGFDLTSDAGVQFGGWALDDVCVVANPASICGDGVQSPTEQCDDGAANANAADACRTTCRLPMCGDGIVDSGEACDGGPGGNDVCDAACEKIDVSIKGACAAGGGGGAASLVLVGAALLVARRRRA